MDLKGDKVKGWIQPAWSLNIHCVLYQKVSSVCEKEIHHCENMSTTKHSVYIQTDIQTNNLM